MTDRYVEVIEAAKATIDGFEQGQGFATWAAELYRLQAAVRSLRREEDEDGPGQLEAAIDSAWQHVAEQVVGAILGDLMDRLDYNLHEARWFTENVKESWRKIVVDVLNDGPPEEVL
jgi:hypothetical protein